MERRGLNVCSTNSLMPMRRQREAISMAIKVAGFSSRFYLEVDPVSLPVTAKFNGLGLNS